MSTDKPKPEAKQRRANGTFTDAPFLRDVSVFDAAEAGDLVGAGDFDADGHWDAVTARRGEEDRTFRLDHRACRRGRESSRWSRQGGVSLRLWLHLRSDPQSV